MNIESGGGPLEIRARFGIPMLFVLIRTFCTMVLISTSFKTEIGMDKPEFLRTLRALTECYHAFGRYSGRHVRALGLTPPQFDVIATLGNTDGMTFRELGAATLITKGTLTGVIDRLEARALVRRRTSPRDGRSVVVSLTDDGNEKFNHVFAAHVGHLAVAFERQAPDRRLQLEELLGELRGHLEAAATETALQDR